MEGVTFTFPDENDFTVPMLCLQAYCPKCSKTYSKSSFGQGRLTMIRQLGRPEMVELFPGQVGRERGTHRGRRQPL